MTSTADFVLEQLLHLEIEQWQVFRAQTMPNSGRYRRMQVILSEAQRSHDLLSLQPRVGKFKGKSLVLLTSFLVEIMILTPNALLAQNSQARTAVGGKAFPKGISVEAAMIHDCVPEDSSSVIWRARAGSQVASTVAGGGRIFVATNNERPRDSFLKEDRGVLMCFNTNGTFLWQSSHPRLSKRSFDLPGSPIHCQPSLDGKRVYYLSNRGELVCLDSNGFLDGKNDGPFSGEERQASIDADVIWKLDLVGELGVERRDAHDVGTPISSPLVVGDVVYCLTQHGHHDTLKEENSANHQRRSQSAPSFLGADKITGRILWTSSLPSGQIAYGQWSSPVAALAGGREQIIFPSGDGNLYAFDSAANQVYRFLNLRTISAASRDAGSPIVNQEGIVDWVPLARPTVSSNYLIIGCNWDFEFPGKCPIAAFDLRNQTETNRPIWTFYNDDFMSTFSPALVRNGLVYVLGWRGTLFALALATGKEVWRCDLNDGRASFWGELSTSGDRLFVTSETMLTVFSMGEDAKCLARYRFNGFNPTTPVFEDGILYVGCGDYLYAIRRDD